MASQSQSKIVHLASIITSNTNKYDDYISSHGLPSPTFDVSAPLKTDLPDDIAQANNAVVEATSELQALMLGPLGNVRKQAKAHNDLIGIHAVCRFGIATSFAVNEEASFEAISRTCGLREPELRRILRFVMTKHIFTEPRKGIVAHTASSKALAQLPPLRDYVGMVCEEMWPAASRGFAYANNTGDTLFKELGKFPQRSKRFAATMSMMINDKGFEPIHLVNAYPWATMGTKVFVDIGGSHGRMSIALAQNVPSIECIVQELPEVVTEGESKIPSELRGRVKFMAHDFFTEQPLKGADVYFFRWIFHDWSDKYCINILQNLIPALKHGARVIISDRSVPPPGTVSLHEEYQIRSFDLAMLELLNSKEREADDWAALFKNADSRFDFIGVRTPPESKLSFIDARWGGGTS